MVGGSAEENIGGEAMGITTITATRAGGGDSGSIERAGDVVTTADWCGAGCGKQRSCGRGVRNMMVEGMHDRIWCSTGAKSLTGSAKGGWKSGHGRGMFWASENIRS